MRNDSFAVVTSSFAIVFLIALFSINRRHNLPILLLVVMVKALALPIAYVLPNHNAIMYYLASALIDLLMAFWLVMYHNDARLFRMFRVENPPHIPQVYLMALILFTSSFVSCIQSIEYLMFFFDENFYNESPPLVSSNQEEIKLVLNVLFDLCICSLLLDPNRWKILQKIQDKFLAP